MNTSENEGTDEKISTPIQLNKLIKSVTRMQESISQLSEKSEKAENEKTAIFYIDARTHREEKDQNNVSRQRQRDVRNNGRNKPLYTQGPPNWPPRYQYQPKKFPVNNYQSNHPQQQAPSYYNPRKTLKHYGSSGQLTPIQHNAKNPVNTPSNGETLREFSNEPLARKYTRRIFRKRFNNYQAQIQNHEARPKNMGNMRNLQRSYVQHQSNKNKKDGADKKQEPCEKEIQKKEKDAGTLMEDMPETAEAENPKNPDFKFTLAELREEVLKILASLSNEFETPAITPLQPTHYRKNGKVCVLRPEPKIFNLGPTQTNEAPDSV